MLHLTIVDDEAAFREDLAALLRRRGFECRAVGDVKTAVEAVKKAGSGAVLCDVVMPGGGAMALLRALPEAAEIGVFVMTAYGSLESAMEAFRAGAVDYLLKPLNLDEVEQKVRRFFDHRKAIGNVRRLRHELHHCTVDPTRLVGRSRAIAHVHEIVERVASTRTTVCVTGETGTGKEITARLIHDASPWRDEPFVAVNCAALPDTLIEGELFGHVQGAFTGAMRDKTGFIEAAQGGTLFLDEIGELGTGTQAKLLRVVAEKKVVRLGSTEPRPVDIRLIAATNRDLRERVKEGKFREDLFFRLSVMELRLPPLRERREDIPLLVEHFVRKFGADLKRDIHAVAPGAMQLLLAYPWPGNVRELQNAIERAFILAQGEVISAEDLPERLAGEAPRPLAGDDLRAAVRVYEQEHIKQVLAAAGGNKEEAARRLGIDPATLYRKLSALAEQPDQ